jgi:hypothetical protein
VTPPRSRRWRSLAGSHPARTRRSAGLIKPLVVDAVPVETKAFTRDDCPTCNAGRDELGRLPIGFCGPDCLARKARDARLRGEGPS